MPLLLRPCPDRPLYSVACKIVDFSYSFLISKRAVSFLGVLKKQFFNINENTHDETRHWLVTVILVILSCNCCYNRIPFLSRVGQRFLQPWVKQSFQLNFHSNDCITRLKYLLLLSSLLWMTSLMVSLTPPVYLTHVFYFQTCILRV